MKKIIALVFVASLLIPSFAFAFIGGGQWMMAGATDTTPPTLTSATIPSAGTSISLLFSENVSIGSGGNAGWTISMSGGAATMTYSSGSGSNTLVYTLSRTVNSNETGTVAYTQPGNGVEDLAGNDLVTIASHTVTNISTQTLASCGTGSELVCENFDGTSACGDSATSTCNTTWTKSGSPTFNFEDTTSPAPLQGTYSAISTTGQDAGSYNASFTAEDTVGVYFIINATTLVGGNGVVFITDASGNTLAELGNQNPEIRLYCGSVSSYEATWVQGTTYHIWIDYTKGTGSNATCHLYHSTTGTKPGSANITITTGDATTQASKIVLTHTQAGATTVYDKIRVGTSAFGSNPQ